MAQRQRKKETAPATPARRVQPQRRFRRPRIQRSLQRLVRRHPAYVVAALVALHALLAFLTFLPQPHTGGDSAAYITLARSLLENGTYSELWEPGAPPHTKYPPVFPGVLALAMMLGFGSWVRLKIAVAALSCVGVAFTFLWLRARRRGALALGVGFITAIAPGVLNEGHWVLSDVPFWAFTMVALWAFERQRAHERVRFAVGALAVLLAYFTRSAGLPLVIAVLVWLAWRRRWQRLAVLAGVIAIPALLWMLRARAFGPSGYVSEFWLIDPYTPALGRIGVGDLFQRVIANAGRYVGIHLPVLLSLTRSMLLVVLSAAIFVFAITGWVRRLRTPAVADLFVPFYLGLILIWPAVWSGERFLLPVLPLIICFAASTLLGLLRRLAPVAVFPAALASIALLAFVALPGLRYAAALGGECRGAYNTGERYPCLGGPAWTDFFAFAERSDDALPVDAVVLSRKPRLFYALGRRAGRVFPFSDDPATFFATADSLGARYVVLDRVDAVSDRYLVPVLLRRPAAFCLMRASDVSGTVLFGILPGHANAPDRGEAGLNDAANTTFAACGPEYWRSAEAEQGWSGS